MVDEILREEKKYLSRWRGLYALFVSKPIRAYQLLTQGIPLSKIINILLCNYSLRIKSPKVFGYPYNMLIEPTNICGLKCHLCPTGCGTLNRPNGMMSFEMFKEIIDKMKKYLVTVYLTNYGEPFLNKDIYRMIEYAKQMKIKVDVATNAMNFNHKEDIRRLIATGIDRVIVSVDGATQETYAAYRKSGDFKKVIENLRMMMEEKKRMGKTTPYVELQFIVMKHNEHEIPQIRKIAQEIGVDCLAIKPATFNNADWNNQEILNTYREFMPSDEKYQPYEVSASEVKWKQRIKNKCDSLWFGPVILWDGVIVPCCLDPRGELKMGEMRDGIKEVWNNARYKALRKQVLKDKTKLMLCSKCLGIS